MATLISALGCLDAQAAWKVGVEAAERSAVAAVKAGLNLTLDRTRISFGTFAADAEALKPS
jgi:hypothetical protein